MSVDVISVCRDDEVDGWWGGEIEGKAGYFPKDFVLPLGDKTNEKIIKVSFVIIIRHDMFFLARKKCLVKKIHSQRVSNQVPFYLFYFILYIKKIFSATK
jgi:hypothetical protein